MQDKRYSRVVSLVPGQGLVFILFLLPRPATVKLCTGLQPADMQPVRHPGGLCPEPTCFHQTEKNALEVCAALHTSSISPKIPKNRLEIQQRINGSNQCVFSGVHLKAAMEVFMSPHHPSFSPSRHLSSPHSPSISAAASGLSQSFSLWKRFWNTDPSPP
jgi:hypothetical protein